MYFLSLWNEAHFTNLALCINLTKGLAYIVNISENKSNLNCLYMYADQEAAWHAKVED